MNTTISKQKIYREVSEGEKNSPFVSNTFKLWIVAFIFLLIFLRLFAIYKYPESRILPDEIILSFVLVPIAYIWFQEFRDRQRLQVLNKVLINTQEQLQHAEVDTIRVLILTEEAKSPYVRGHSMMVARCSLAIASEMGFSKERQMIVERAAILHDLGKIGIMDDILNKPDKLTAQEWEVMKGHPKRAVQILEPLEFLSKEKEILLHHHEKYDGTGYPDHLKGEEIPLESRIIKIADFFDALNSDRAYRKALPRDVTMSELKKASGHELDSSVLNIFLNLLEKKPYLWERD